MPTTAFDYRHPRFEDLVQHGPYQLATDAAHPFPRHLTRVILTQLFSTLWQQVTGSGRVLRAPQRQNDVLAAWPSVLAHQPLTWLAGGFVWANHQPTPSLNDLRPTLRFYDWSCVITTAERRQPALDLLNRQFANQWTVFAFERVDDHHITVTIDQTAGQTTGYHEPHANTLARGYLLTRDQLLVTLHQYANDTPTWRGFLVHRDWSHTRKLDLLSIVSTNSTSEHQEALRQCFNQAILDYAITRPVPVARHWHLV